MPFSVSFLSVALGELPQPSSYLLAFSGGGDSTALLHGLKALDAPVRAVHVNHQLHPDAERWAAHCRAVCHEWDVPLEVVSVEVTGAAEQGMEAAARRARYAALRERLGENEMLLTAHHQDDQAETVMLQLLRGAGVQGLAGMRACRRFGAGLHGRPLLSVSQADLRDYLKANGLQWLEDPANRDPAHKRNFLRHQVLPLLESRWPAARSLLARAAGNLREVSVLMDEIAVRDLAHARTDNGALALDAVAELPPARRRLLLRAWLDQAGLPLPERVQLDQLETQIAQPRPDAEICVAWPGAEARVYRGRLYAMPPKADPAPAFECPWDGREPMALPTGLGFLALEPAETARGASGLALRVRFRRGGERIRLAGNDHHTELKALFQDMDVAPWERSRVPLLFDGDELAAVGDWRLTDRFAGELRSRGLNLVWR